MLRICTTDTDKESGLGRICSVGDSLVGSMQSRCTLEAQLCSEGSFEGWAAYSRAPCSARTAQHNAAFRSRRVSERDGERNGPGL